MYGPSMWLAWALLICSACGKVPVVVVEEHDQVLEHWYSHVRSLNHVGSRIVVHVDSHPDMATPAADEELPGSWEDGDTTQYGIASFILPAVYSGFTDRVVFVRPPWARQYAPDGIHHFTFGSTDRAQGPKQYGVDLDIPYYWSSAEWWSTEALVDGARAKLAVVPLSRAADAVCESDGFAAHHGLACSWDAPVILDIDLDTFIVRNEVSLPACW